MRTSVISRKTNETDITLKLNLDGTGKSTVNTGCGFLDHMLTLFSRHARFDLEVNCKGDTEVDFHHTAEDIGIVLGQALRDALKDKKGIVRYGSCILPMDEALIMTAVDISGRSYLKCSFEGLTEKVGDFDTELVEEFFYAFTRQAELTLHIKQLDGINTHHILEGAFKSVARSLRAAVKIDEEFKDEIPSTKGVL
ncbi:MAG: imidazoleglycerol-phosphate dehydratase HisB [Clostridia bacterium]|nr:imidazoleglycerol-phosphate dehydratase HisB [Clostridia bacterium]